MPGYYKSKISRFFVNQMEASFTNERSYSEIAMQLVHISELDTLHRWDLTVDLRNLTEIQFKAVFERVCNDKESETVKQITYNTTTFGLKKKHKKKSLCLSKTTLEGTVENMVFLQRPYAIRGAADYNTTKSSAVSAHVDFNFTAGHSDNTVELFAAQDRSQSGCPKEILLFHPPPSAKFCDASSFANISMLSKYTVDLQVSNVSY